MKASKVSTLTAGIVLLLAAGLLSGCGEEPEEAVNQSEGMAIEPVPSEETAGAPIAAIDDTEDFSIDSLEGIADLESIEDLEGVEHETDMFEGISETTDEFIDKSTETISQTADTVSGFVDDSIDAAQDVLDEEQTIAPSTIEEAQVPTTAGETTEVVTVTPEIIRGVQQALVDAGFNPGPVDGISGPRTLAALENFQKQNNIPAGQFTKETLQALDVDY